MYWCMGRFRFSFEGLNLAFGTLFLLLPFAAVKSALRLSRWAKMMTLILLVPALAISVLGLSALVACEIPSAIGHVQRSRELCTLQHGDYSVRLSWDETAGGALGPHGVSLQQRRRILPGLYLVKFVDYFDGASAGTLAWTGSNRIALFIPISGYDRDQKNIHRQYVLKPWLYF